MPLSLHNRIPLTTLYYIFILPQEIFLSLMRSKRFSYFANEVENLHKFPTKVLIHIVEEWTHTRKLFFRNLIFSNMLLTNSNKVHAYSKGIWCICTKEARNGNFHNTHSLSFPQRSFLWNRTHAVWHSVNGLSKIKGVF